MNDTKNYLLGRLRDGDFWSGLSAALTGLAVIWFPNYARQILETGAPISLAIHAFFPDLTTKGHDDEKTLPPIAGK